MGFGDDFLAKRYAAGLKDGYAEGIEIWRAAVLKFLEENPGATAKEVEEWARSRDERRKGEETGRERRSSRPSFCGGASGEGKGMGFGDELLAERYMSGWKEGFKESFAKNFAIGREEGRKEGIEIGNDQALKLMEENPGATVDQIRELLRNGDARRRGKGRRG